MCDARAPSGEGGGVEGHRSEAIAELGSRPFQERRRRADRPFGKPGKRVGKSGVESSSSWRVRDFLVVVCDVCIVESFIGIRQGFSEIQCVV